MKRMNKLDRCMLICRMYLAIEDMADRLGLSDDGHYFGWRHCAFWMNMKPSSHLKRLMDFCVAVGWLERREFDYRENIKSHSYRITETGRYMVQQSTERHLPLL